MALCALAAGLLLLGCGGDEKSKLERGLTVDQEEAVPGDAREFEMPAAAREQAIDEEDAKRAAEEFDRAEAER